MFYGDPSSSGFTPIPQPSAGPYTYKGHGVSISNIDTNGLATLFNDNAPAFQNFIDQEQRASQLGAAKPIPKGGPRAKALAPRNARVQASVASTVNTNPPSGLPPFGTPPMSAVDKIVQAMINSASRAYTSSNQDLARMQAGDEIKNARVGLAGMRGVAGVGRAMNNLSKASLQQTANSTDNTSSNLALAADQALGTGYNAGADANTNQTIAGIGSSALSQDATADSALRQGLVAGNSQTAGLLGAMAMQGRENNAQTSAAYRQGVMQNLRAIAAAKADAPLDRLSAQKQLQDMYIANKLAQAQYASAGSNIQSQATDRQVKKASLSLDEKKLNAQLKTAGAGKQQAWSQAITQVLLGGTQTVWKDGKQNTTSIPPVTDQAQAVAAMIASGVPKAVAQAAAANYFSYQNSIPGMQNFIQNGLFTQPPAPQNPPLTGAFQ